MMGTKGRTQKEAKSDAYKRKRKRATEKERGNKKRRIRCAVFSLSAAPLSPAH